MSSPMRPNTLQRTAVRAVAELDRYPPRLQRLLRRQELLLFIPSTPDDVPFHRRRLMF